MNVSTSSDDTPYRQLKLLDSVLNAVKMGAIVLDPAQRVVLWNRWMEQHSGLQASDVLGKSFAALFPDMENSRTHHAVRDALQHRFASVISQTLNKIPFPLYATPADAQSGIRIQQAIQVLPLAIDVGANHCLVQVTDVSMAVAREQVLRNQSLELQAQIFTDGLTGIANRRRFDAHLESEFRRAKRAAVPLSLIMIDVDCFKSYNDNYGHQKGDQCLIAIAAALSRVTGRPSDLIARYGGEEFAAILPDTNDDGALLLAERLRVEVADLVIEHAGSSVGPTVTISVGVATRLPGQGMTLERLIGAADRALYQAKHAGRNCIVAYRDMQAPPH